MPDATTPTDDLVELIAGLVTGESLMAEHARDEHGRCRCCRSGHDGSAHVLWPCDGHLRGRQVARLQERARVTQERLLPQIAK